MNTYYFEIGADVLDYIRRVLGARPYDESAPVIGMLERGRSEQDQRRQETPQMTGNGHDKDRATHREQLSCD